MRFAERYTIYRFGCFFVMDTHRRLKLSLWGSYLLGSESVTGRLRLLCHGPLDNLELLLLLDEQNIDAVGQMLLLSQGRAELVFQRVVREVTM